MRSPDRINAREVRDRTGDSKNPCSAATGQPKAVYRLFDKFGGIRSKLYRVAVNFRVVGWTGWSVTFAYHEPRPLNSVRDRGTWLTTGSISQFGGCGGLNLH